MKLIQTLSDKWKAFREWQIGDCKDAAGQGDKKLGKEFFRGTIDNAIPFLSGETFRTMLQLLFRPGYMIREFLRGKDNRILNPLTALIVFFAMQVLLTNMVVTGSDVPPSDVFDTVTEKMHESEFSPESEWGDLFAMQIVNGLAKMYYITHLDQYPAKVHSHSEQMLAGIEGWLRSQGVFTFITQLLLLCFSLWIVGHRRYRLTLSASASIAAYMLCQLCFFNTLLIIFTLGASRMIPNWLIALLLFENIYQLLGIGWKRSLGYVALLVLTLTLLSILGLALFAGAISLYAYWHM